MVLFTENIFANIIDLVHSTGGEGFNYLNIEKLSEDEEISDAELVKLIN